MSPALLDRTANAGTRAHHDRRGPNQFTLAAISRLPLVVGAMVLGALWIVLISLAPGNHHGWRGSWAVHLASRLLLRSLGVRLVQRANPRSGASLVVTNCVSWLDLLVLSAAGPVRPVANAEVAGWPLIGSLARRSGAIFIDQNRLSGLPGEVEQIAAALRRGHRVLVFPPIGLPHEAAANPARRAAFQAAVDAAVVISPVAVNVRGLGVCPTALSVPPGATALVASLIRIVADRVTAEVRWLPVIPAIVNGGHPAGDRARAAAAAQRAITGVAPRGDRLRSHTNSLSRKLTAQSAAVADETTEPAPAPRAAKSAQRGFTGSQLFEANEKAAVPVLVERMAGENLPMRRSG